MNKILNIPHRTSHGMCPVNGIRDLVQWRAGQDWSNEFLWGYGQGGGFTYLRINVADPPRQVYTGISIPRQHRYLAGLFQAGFTESENRAFKSYWAKAQQAVEVGTPPILGPLDMYHLHYYPQLYHQRHIPIHFVLLVGYDEDTAYIHDTDKDALQAIPPDELQLLGCECTWLGQTQSPSDPGYPPGIAPNRSADKAGDPRQMPDNAASAGQYGRHPGDEITRQRNYILARAVGRRYSCQMPQAGARIPKFST